MGILPGARWGPAQKSPQVEARRGEARRFARPAHRHARIWLSFFAENRLTVRSANAFRISARSLPGLSCATVDSKPTKPVHVVRIPGVYGAGKVRFEVKNLDQRWFADMYHYMLAVTWRRLLGWFFLVYLATNAFFAFFYWLGGSDISNARPGSYADAFWFSVQTYATIGYGGMAPASTYAHVLVTLEAFTGMMAMAIGTGIVFAKFSRPTARIAFSQRMVVHVRNARPVLEFRLANQRSGSLSDANMKLSVLRDEVTAEGQPMRRSHPLELERSQMPVLSLAWNLIHVLDETSPLHGLEPGDSMAHIVGFIASLTAHDDTMAETVHARQFYSAEDVLHNVRFVDMIDSKSVPGVISIDHALLNEVGPIPLSASLAPAAVTTDANSKSGAAAAD
jgi:inward rectifier potassium channel